MRAGWQIGSVSLGDVPRIVAAGGEDDLDALCAASDADLLELRADLFASPTPAAITAALRSLRSAGRPILLTVRAASEGGRAMPDAQRRALYEAGLPLADAIDVELASADLAAAIVPACRTHGKVVVRSFHDFAATPTAVALRGIIERAHAAGADIAKVATMAHSLDDVRTLLEVTLACRDRGVVTLAMGPIGALSRVFFPAAGSLLTFGCVGEPTAPGQLPVRELAALRRQFYPEAH